MVALSSVGMLATVAVNVAVATPAVRTRSYHGDRYDHRPRTMIDSSDASSVAHDAVVYDLHLRRTAGNFVHGGAVVAAVTVLQVWWLVCCSVALAFSLAARRLPDSEEPDMVR